MYAARQLALRITREGYMKRFLTVGILIAIIGMATVETNSSFA